MLRTSLTLPAPGVASHPLPASSLARIRPKPIFFTRFNTLEIFYVRIILMVVRGARRVMTLNIFLLGFLPDPLLAASQIYFCQAQT